MTEYLEKHNLKTKEEIAQHIIELKRNTFPDLELISSLASYLFDGETQTVTMPFGREFLTVVVEKENHNKQRELNEHISEIIKDAGTKDHGEVKPNSTRHKAPVHCGGYDKPKFPLKKLEQLIKDGKNCRNGNMCFCDGSCKEVGNPFEKLLKKKYECFKEESVFKDNPILGADVQIVGKKENKDKTDYSEIDWDIIDLMAKRFNDNKHKYPPGNMLKPIDKKELLFASFRHLRKMIQPIDNDEETFQEHLTAVLCNMQMIYQQDKLNKS